ncbi:D-tyrosyl-tRNA(Tyr) deacylase [Malassezia sp. CBS 17886]|nr:D-tyrosyl-tRNA(Tyr) deacylase [Malassezia sp. CBS 17886]
MKAVLQRVKQASVHVDGELVSHIGPGILALIGVSTADGPEHMDMLTRKILSLKLWPEGAHTENGRFNGVDPTHARPWRVSVAELGGEVLCVSQFTLYAKTVKGTKPDFHNAMSGPAAELFYGAFLDKMRSSYEPDRVRDGKFGAMMDVSLVNDGG